MESFKIFGKWCWYLSIVVIFLFFIALEAYRIYDYTTGNYSIQKMRLTEFRHSSGSRKRGGRSIMVIGYIGKEKVYFSRFNDDIKKLYKLYPQIFSTNKKNYEIKVLKFEHSPRVLLIDDNEFSKWKKHLLLAFSYITLSIIVILILKK